jgi:hypothetical protein
MEDIYHQIVASDSKTFEFALSDNRINMKVYQNHVNEEESFDVFEKLKVKRDNRFGLTN